MSMYAFVPDESSCFFLKKKKKHILHNYSAFPGRRHRSWDPRIGTVLLSFFRPFADVKQTPKAVKSSIRSSKKTKVMGVTLISERYTALYTVSAEALRR